MKLRVDINLDKMGKPAGYEVERLLGFVANLYAEHTLGDFVVAQGVPLLNLKGEIVGGVRIVRDVTVTPPALEMGS